MMTCNLAQAGFVAHLADEYLDGMLANRALTRPFVDACVAKLSEVNWLTVVMNLLSRFSEDSVIDAGTTCQVGCIIRDALTSEC